MVIFLLLLPFVSPYSTFWDHLNKNLNSKVGVCDNFYDHVCSNVVEKPWEQFEQQQTIAMNSLLLSYQSDETYDIVQRINRDTRYPSTLGPDLYYMKLSFWCDGEANTDFVLDGFADIAKHFGSTLKTAKNCVSRAKNVISDSLYPLEKKLVDSVLWLDNLDRMVAYADLGRIVTYHEEERIMKELFETVRGSLMDTIKNSAILKAKGLVDSMIKTLKAVKLWSLDNLEKYRPKRKAVVKSFDLCYDNLPYVSNVEVLSCLAFAVKKQFDLTNENEQLLFAMIDNNTARHHSALYDPTHNTLFLSPITYYHLKKFNNLALLSSLGTMIAHQLAHAVFNDNNMVKECVSKNMERGCRLFFAGDACKSANVSEEETAADFSSIRTVLNLVRKDPKHLLLANSKLTKPLTADQLFFYTYTASTCNKLQPHRPMEDGSADPVIARTLRINSVFRHFKEFKDAFGCRQGDRMVLEKDDHCQLSKFGPDMWLK